ncbi:hypothetical protein [uncultured Microbulbifer sp.]|uniref:hypothetical protein n=1 Tax=uncultured Microbulbifer sp. TaxID=348147 RepID=UPI0026347B26|nr:hypothetical protein [uncultured Microbulbifer sp.]
MSNPIPIHTTNLNTLDYFNEYLKENGTTEGIYKSFCLTFTNLLNGGQWVNFKLSQTVTLGEGKHKRSAGGADGSTGAAT